MTRGPELVANEAMDDRGALPGVGTETATGPTAAVVERTLVVMLMTAVEVQVLWQLLVVRVGDME